MGPSENVVEFYKGKTIFMTGVTGFVGVTLLEKILRCVPTVGNIYVLMRPKKGKEIKERLEEIKSNSVFEKLKEINSKEELDKLFSKVIPIAGDVGEANLGMSPEDRKLITDNVNIFFHSAATLDFEATLRPTVQINILGTRRIMELASETKNMSALVHVSSAYVNAYRIKCEEILYPEFMPADEIIGIVEKQSDEELAKLAPGILNDHPNTYTFTKHLAEHEVAKCQEKFPCAIVRPSMITGAWKEPIPGWTISKNGPQGFLMGASKGVIRRLPVATNLIYDYIPIDIVVNQLLVSAAYVGITKPDKVQIYHCTSSTRKPFKWAFVERRINDYLHKFPLKSAVWYPHLKFISSIAWFKFSCLFVHLIPAIILDTVTKLSGGRPILMRLHRNVNASLDRLERFIFTEWMFEAERSDQLHDWLTVDDRKNFGISLKNLDWRDYFIELCKGVRQYLNKESMKNISVAMSKDKILFILHLLLQGAIYFSLWYGAASVIGTTLSKSVLILPVLYYLFSLL